MTIRQIFTALFAAIALPLILTLTACQTGAAPSQTLYAKLGGDAGVTSIIQGTLAYTLKDARIAHTFENSNVERVEGLLIEQVCALTGGPCEYTGQTMERSHRGLGLTTLHFNALVENMQKAMNDNRVPYRTQNQLLALLAPMHDDVVGH